MDKNIIKNLLVSKCVFIILSWSEMYGPCGKLKIPAVKRVDLSTSSYILQENL